MKSLYIISASFLTLLSCKEVGQKTAVNDTNTPLHLMQPDYPTPYGAPSDSAVMATLERVHGYLETHTPYGFVNSKTDEELTDYNQIDENTQLKKGDFRLVSYEWGVTYAAMLRATQTTGDERFKKYATERLGFIADAAPYFSKLKVKKGAEWGVKGPFTGLIDPHALDDCGAMCTAMLKAKAEGSKAPFDDLIAIHIDYIMNKEHRLADGNLARNRPQPNSVWLDDVFMGLPALAQMGKATGEQKYYDEATRQMLLFKEKMWNSEKQLFMHGWVEGMSEHPQYHWGRANGWAILTLVEILDVLPETHKNYGAIKTLLQQHLQGLAKLQDGTGFWHQLLDRNDTYLETSATAIYTYCYAKAINRGWIDAAVYSPVAILGWNAVSTKVSDIGQVEGTCVGTGMGFDPAFYYFRPTSPYAAHGYGPVLFAGAEVIELLKTHTYEINDSSVQLLTKK